MSTVPSAPSLNKHCHRQPKQLPAAAVAAAQDTASAATTTGDNRQERLTGLALDSVVYQHQTVWGAVSRSFKGSVSNLRSPHLSLRVPFTRRASSQGSLFSALLQPLRSKDSQPQTSSAGGARSATQHAPPSSAAVSGGGLTSPLDSQPGSPRQLSSAHFDSSPSLVPGTTQAQLSQQPQQQQQQQQPWTRLAQLHAAGTGLLQATGSSDWGELRNVIRNPAAALSSITARIGNQLQPG
jgi:hypothetical protein